MDKVVEALEESGAEEVYLFPELIHPFEFEEDRLLEELDEHLARVELHRQRRGRVSERQRRAVVAARARRTRGDLRRRLGGDLERGKRRLLADLARDDLVDRRRHARAGRARIGAHAAEPGRGHDRVHRVLIRLVLEVRERGHVALVLLERREDRAELEIRARAARRPVVHLGTERRIPEDRAVRDIEESRAQLRRGRRGRERGRGRDHRIEQRQADRDAEAAEHGSATGVFSSNTSATPRFAASGAFAMGEMYSRLAATVSAGGGGGADRAWWGPAAVN